MHFNTPSEVFKITIDVELYVTTADSATLRTRMPMTQIT